MEIQDFSHDHTLTFHKVGDEKADGAPRCNGCTYHIRGPAYTCKDCNNMFWLHKSCAELPLQIQHPRHPAHPLSLLREPPSNPPVFICDGCAELTACFTYYCHWCRFSLDVKCVSSLSEHDVLKSEVQTLKHREIKSTIFHFSHRHQLTRCYLRREFEFPCKGCIKPVTGSVAYFCTTCPFILHESCLDMPGEVENPFHPQHPLRPRVMEKDEGRFCDACNKRLPALTFCCSPCDFHLHVSCAKITTRALNHKCHKHDLFYYMPEDNSFRCDVCYTICSGVCYRCIECDFNVHLRCVPIPELVKHDRHPHPLTLMNRFLEYDSEQYYCDICETERDPEHHVYCCEECVYVAHIDCVISKDDDSVDILSYTIQKSNETEDSDGDETVSDEEEDERVEKEVEQPEAEQGDEETICPSKVDYVRFIEKDVKQEETEKENESAEAALPELDAEIAKMELMISIRTEKLEALTEDLEALRIKLEAFKKKQASDSSS